MLTPNLIHFGGMWYMLKKICLNKIYHILYKWKSYYNTHIENVPNV